MATKRDGRRRYAIKEAAKLSGLPESTLRYYESIGLIDPIGRDPSSKQRIYSEDDINLIVSVACLSATGMSIEDMRAYLGSRGHGARSANGHKELLEAQRRRLAEEGRYLKLRRRYVDTKIAYWCAVASGDKKKVEAMRKRAHAIAKELNRPKESRKITNINK
jgi:DNA-binding transcriptional MerR regulator